MSTASDADASAMPHTSLVESYELIFKIGDSHELHLHGVGTVVTVQQTGGEVRIESKPQHSDEGEVGTSNKRDACIVIRIRPVTRSSRQAQEREKKQQEVEMDSQWPDTCV